MPAVEVGVLGVSNVVGETMPDYFEPAVGQGSQGIVAGFIFGDFDVVELAPPGEAAQTAKRPLVYGDAEVAVVGQSAGDDKFAATRYSGDGCGARIALKRVGGVELSDVVPDLIGDAGGEAISETGEAQVDLTAEDCFSQVGVPRLFGAAFAAGTQQQLAHAAFPALTGFAQAHQLGRGQCGGRGLGADQVVPHRQLLGGQDVKDTSGEALWPAMARGASDASQGVVVEFGELGVSAPRSQQRQDDRAAQFIAGELQCGRKGREQIDAQPVDQSAFVAGGAFVVAGNRAQPTGQLTVPNEFPQVHELIQRDQTADAGVLGVVFLAGPRRRATKYGLTRSRVNPASSSVSTSTPRRVSSTTRISAGPGSRSKQRATSRPTRPNRYLPRANAMPPIMLQLSVTGAGGVASRS